MNCFTKAVIVIPDWSRHTIELVVDGNRQLPYRTMGEKPSAVLMSEMIMEYTGLHGCFEGGWVMTERLVPVESSSLHLGYMVVISKEFLTKTPQLVDIDYQWEGLDAEVDMELVRQAKQRLKD